MLREHRFRRRLHGGRHRPPGPRLLRPRPADPGPSRPAHHRGPFGQRLAGDRRRLPGPGRDHLRQHLDQRDERVRPGAALHRRVRDRRCRCSRRWPSWSSTCSRPGKLGAYVTEVEFHPASLVLAAASCRSPRSSSPRSGPDPRRVIGAEAAAVRCRARCASTTGRQRGHIHERGDQRPCGHRDRSGPRHRRRHRPATGPGRVRRRRPRPGRGVGQGHRRGDRVRRGPRAGRGRRRQRRRRRSRPPSSASSPSSARRPC